jgi:hypothetical protein
MPQLSYDFLFSHKHIIFVHEAYIEPKNAQYHHYLCVNLAFTYLIDYPELFVVATDLQDILQQIQKSSDTQKSKLIEKYVSKKLIQLADFQIYSLEYYLLSTVSQLNNKDFYYCIIPIEFLDSNSIVKKIIVENFEIQEILTSWNDEFFYAAPSQRIILKIRNKRPKISTKTNSKLSREVTNSYQQLFFTNVYNFSELDELSTFVSIVKEKDEIQEKLVKTAEHISFHAANTHITWAVGIDFLFKNTNLTNWSKFLKMNSLYGNLLAKCRYMLTPFKNTTNLQTSFNFADAGLYPLIPIAKNFKTTNLINTYEFENEIENKYLRHVISNSNEIELLTQKVENVGQIAFYCTKTQVELQKSKDDLAYNYIKQLEEKIKNNTESIDSQLVTKWYSPKQSISDALADTKITNYFHWIENHENNLHTATIIGLNWKKESIKYFLRSSFWHFWLENEIAIFNVDGFVLMPEKLAEILVINADLLNTEAIRLVYNNLQKCEVLNPSEEITQKDTQELDALIAEALGLEADILVNLYADLHGLYLQRLMIQTVNKRYKNPKIFLKIVKNYIDNLTSGERLGEKDFPQFVANYISNHNDIEFENYLIENSKVKILDFLGTYEIYADKKLLFTTNSQLKIEFVKLINLGTKNVLQIPKNEENIKLILTDFKEQLNSSKNLAKDFVKEKFVNSWIVNSFL